MPVPAVPGGAVREPVPQTAADVFGAGKVAKTPPLDVKVLHTKIGQLTLENDFLERALSKADLLSGVR